MGNIADMTDPNGLVVCRNCGMVRTWATRPMLPTPCVSAHQLVDGTALMHWTLERVGRIVNDYLESMFTAGGDEYQGRSDQFEARIEDLRDEMVLRFGQRAVLWHRRAVTVALEQVSDWLDLDRAEIAHV